MPPPADSPMNKDLYDRIEMIAEFDDEAEKPSRLRIILANGFEIADCHLIDGSNSLDDKTIDVKTEADGMKANWIVVIDQIAAIHHTFPGEEK